MRSSSSVVTPGRDVPADLDQRVGRDPAGHPHPRDRVGVLDHRVVVVGRRRSRRRSAAGRSTPERAARRYRRRDRRTSRHLPSCPTMGCTLARPAGMVGWVGARASRSYGVVADGNDQSGSSCMQVREVHRSSGRRAASATTRRQTSTTIGHEHRTAAVGRGRPSGRPCGGRGAASASASRVPSATACSTDVDQLGADRLERVGVVGEPAGGDLRPEDDLAGLEVDGDEDRQEAFLAEDAAVLQRGVADVADLEPVDVDVADRDRADDRRAVRRPGRRRCRPRPA